MNRVCECRNEWSGGTQAITIPEHQKQKPACSSRIVKQDTFQKLNYLGNSDTLAIFMILLANLQVCLSKAAHQEQVIIDIPLLPLREGSHAASPVLAFQHEVAEGTVFKELLIQTSRKLQECYSQMGEGLRHARKIEEPASFRLMMPELHGRNECLELCEAHGFAGINLSLSASEGHLAIEAYYNPSLYEEKAVLRVTALFETILEQVLNNTLAPLDGLHMLDEHQAAELMDQLTGPRRAYPREKNICTLFEEQAVLTPDQPAVIFGEQRLTYSELNNKANTLGKLLQDKGVGQDTVVGLLMDRSVEMVVGMLGILKAGGAYMPFDPEYPDERIAYMAADSGTPLIVTRRGMRKPGKLDAEWLEIDCGSLEESDDDPVLYHPDSLLYVIYTSGTTGNPKGVMFTNRGLVNLISYQNSVLGIPLDTRVLQFATIAFDVASQEIWSTLLAGGELHLIPDATRKNLHTLLPFMENSGIKTVFLPTSFFKLLAAEHEYLSRLARCVNDIVVAGEQLTLDPAMLKMLGREGTRLHNHYGPTETHVVTAITLQEDCGAVPPIGFPIANADIRILDDHNHAVPVGAVGEICIGGDCLARGYLNNPELTGAKFISHPFIDGQKMYRTGDLGRWLPDGSIECLGRIDHQVKIRGFRVEPGEVEARLQQMQELQSAVVLKKESGGQVYLCAYVVPAAELSVAELRAKLLKSLPEYMIPSYFVPLERMPLTTNGKVDRRALPEPDLNRTAGTAHVEPRSEMEALLAEIWCGVLNCRSIGVYDDFFEQGGHSLKAITLVTRIRQRLQAEVSVAEIFACRTIAKLAGLLSSTHVRAENEAIPQVPDSEYYEVSSAQKRMYMLQQMDQGAAYHIPGAIEITGNLDIGRLEAAIRQLIGRHEPLRTVFHSAGGKIVQRILPMNEVRFSLELCAAESEEEARVQLDCFIRPFDLHADLPLRAILSRLDAERHLLLLDLHHIIADGVTAVILSKELAAFYAGEQPEPLSIQYKDYAAWQTGRQNTGLLGQQKDYWLNRLSGELPVLELPCDYPRPAEKDYLGDQLVMEWDKETAKQLSGMAMENGSTMYMVLLACLNILLTRWSGQEELIIGTPIAGRNHPELEPLAGIFVNTLAIRSTVDHHSTFRQHLEQVKETVLEAFQNQEYPFESLTESLKVVRSLNRNPLFDIMLTMENTDFSKYSCDGTDFQLYDMPYRKEKFDMTWSASEQDDRLRLTISYATALFDRNTIERMGVCFSRILGEVVRNADIPVGEIELISETDREMVLELFNPGPLDYPKDQTISDLIELQTAYTPDNTAISDNGSRWTYRQLNARANALARTLQRCGVREESFVAILSGSSAEMIVAILAVLKAGGTYIPIDPQYPDERIGYILLESGAGLLLTDEKNSERMKGQALRTIGLHDPAAYDSEDGNLNLRIPQKQLAYVIYTSGTTGNPKGVAIEHGSLVNFCCWHNRHFGVDGSDIFAKYAGVGFDASAWEIFPCLLAGAALQIVPEDLRPDAEKLNAFYDQHGITIGFLPISMFERFIQYENRSLRRLLTGAEKLKFVREQTYELHNNYGPTECTILTTSFKIDGEYPNIPIGKPVGNTRVYILNQSNRLQPVGVGGELCVSGDGLAREYLHNDELTNAKFTENPYEPGGRMYRTGDLARWRPDGNIEFLGRIDQQVKIRGFRVELEEIESRMLGIPGIREAAVKDWERDGSRMLCGYYVSDTEIAAASLREALQRTLPDYMVPACYMRLGELKVTANGKMDRKALPEPEGDIRTGRSYTAPRSRTEQRLAGIWAEVLGMRGNPGIHDDFFELGGHSLKVTALITRIHEQLGAVVGVKDVFTAPTIAQLSERISLAEAGDYGEISRVEEQQFYEASSAQKRMFVLQQLDPGSTAYNIPWVISIDGSLNLPRMEAALLKLIERHEALRTLYDMDQERVIQRVLPPVQLNFRLELFTAASGQEMETIAGQFVRPFDIRRSIPVRAGVISLSESRHIWLLDLHHIAADGTTMGILMREFSALYSGKELAPLKLQYKDYSSWQLKGQDSVEMKKHEEYWLQEFSGEIPVLQLPLDYPRPQHKDFRGRHVRTVLGAERVVQLNQLARENDSTLFMVLMAGVKIMLSKYTGQEDIIVGSPIAGRTHKDLEPVAGMFVNTLSFRSRVSGSLSFKQYLEVIRTKALDAYEHQDYPFEDIVEKLGVTRSLNRNPLFDVMFVLQNTAFEELQTDGLAFRQLVPDANVEKFDLTINTALQDEQLVLDISYAESLFDHRTIERMAGHLEYILQQITERPDARMDELQLITEAEIAANLEGYNETACSYPTDRTLHQSFEEQVHRTPDRIAVVAGGDRLTYRELNRRANIIAAELVRKGVACGDMVAVRIGRSADLVAGILAVLKSGAGYIPVETEYPAERLNYILGNSRCPLLLTDGTDDLELIHNTEVMHLSDVQTGTDNAEVNLPDPAVLPSDVAYIIYTSGSTGVPKGVVISHQAALNTCLDINAKFAVDAADSILSVASIGFDLSVYDLFGALISGAQVVIARDPKNIQEIAELLAKEQITIWNSAPPFMEMVLGSLPVTQNYPSLRIVMLSGDWISLNLPARIKEYFPESRLISLGGATEGSIWSIYYPVGEVKAAWKSIPYGYPLGNQQMFIMNEQLHLQPAGITGEIVICGMGVAEGYANDPERTAASFVVHPRFGRLYRTGDLGVLRNEGYIEFLGRKDHQVKIRGYRVELGEIESVMRGMEGIQEVIVMDKSLEGVKVLCAYYLSDTAYPAAVFREKMKASLPEYMVPSYFIRLDTLPLTDNGKLDRKALPEPDGQPVLDHPYVSPRNELESQLVSIWTEVLGAERVGIYDNFFDLGGHSLKATSLIARIRQHCGVDVPLRELFAAGTVERLAEYMMKQEHHGYEEIVKAETRDGYEASSAQKRIYWQQQMMGAGLAYHIPGAFEMKGGLDVCKAEQSLKSLIERHEALRTVFRIKEGEVLQIILPADEAQFRLEYTEAQDESEAAAWMDNFIRPFDLDREILIRAAVIRLEEKRHYLLLDLHHLIADGASVANLISEFCMLYSGAAAGPPRLQYKDYSEWQRKRRMSKEMEAHQAYWLSEFSGQVPVLHLPADHPRPQEKDGFGQHVSLALNPPDAQGLRLLAARNGCTLYMVLLAGIQALLWQYSGQEEIIVGSPVSGRSHRSTEEIIGVFINTIAIKGRLDGQQSFTQHLTSLRTKTLNAFEHQDFPFEKVVELVNPVTQPGRNPLFDVMFILQNKEKADFTIDGLNVRRIPIPFATEKMDMTFTAEDNGETLELDLNYASSLYERRTMETMLHHLSVILTQAVEAPDILLDDLLPPELGIKGSIIEFKEEFHF
ncbi:non-ribosomal peptide synthetase [Paenibacillus sp. PK3_47]|uniref:non-ribosomal peptide synthetase n=1 Tax=Paenibacillus sp. PK3_47 TaxID=2072642 RepID=UPI00201DD9E7|nr:non-ribosomal peptide synthetase [Paenibacillus sp. PK3_47]UQZ35485.1 non-ribosomal peptide synthetase [Paenibacillus sp. PK3_47]